MTIDFPPSLQWVAFDLDDTLHFYRKASGRASAAVFAYLDDEFGCGVDQLKAAYAGILKHAQMGGFGDGRTARECRGERTFSPTSSSQQCSSGVSSGCGVGRWSSGTRSVSSRTGWGR